MITEDTVADSRMELQCLDIVCCILGKDGGTEPSEWNRRGGPTADQYAYSDHLLACCETDMRRDLYRYLGTGVDTKSEVELLAVINKIAVITRSNFVNVVSLMYSKCRADPTNNTQEIIWSHCALC